MDKTKQLLKLKNGSEEFEPLVNVTMLLLEEMFEFRKGKPLGAILFYELIEFCKDSTHKFFGKTGEYLKELTLVDEFSVSDSGVVKYQVDESIRNIVLSAAEGKDLDLCLVNPIAKEK